MAKLKTGELKQFSNILIQDGYVLDLNNAEFKQIIPRTNGIDVYENNCSNKVLEEMGGSSKGKILIYFCHHESEENIIKVLSELIDYAENMDEELDLNKIHEVKENFKQAPKSRFNNRRVFTKKKLTIL